MDRLKCSPCFRFFETFSCHKQPKAMVFFVVLFALGVSGLADFEREALLDIRDHWKMDSFQLWTAEVNKSCSEWAFLVCDSDNHVERLLFDNSVVSVDSTLPRSIGNLTFVKQLDLSGIGLQGTVGRELGKLTEIQVLKLANNSLVGDLPPELGQLQNLQVLDISNNEFAFFVPDCVSSTVTSCDLSGNAFTCIPATMAYCFSASEQEQYEFCNTSICVCSSDFSTCGCGSEDGHCLRDEFCSSAGTCEQLQTVETPSNVPDIGQFFLNLLIIAIMVVCLLGGAALLAYLFNRFNKIPSRMLSVTDHVSSRVHTRITRSEEHRQQFGSKAEFLFAVIGFVVGIGNLYRFPYLAYRHGGGAFVLPYLLSLLLLGVPLASFELLLGQTYRRGPVDIFRAIHPRARGIGTASVFVSFAVVGYYNILLAWSAVFLVHSFRDPVPWADNQNFFYTDVLELTPSISEYGTLQWPILLGLFAMWIFVYLSIFKGVGGSGKVAIVTVSLPYIIVAILFVRGVTLPGAFDGVVEYLRVDDFGRLADARVWVDAASQIFFSLSPCFGILVAFGSFLDKREPTIKDAIAISLLNSFTSLIGGVVVFSVLGYLAREKGVPVSEVASSGPGLAFEVYPQALALMPVPQLFSVLFFIMLLTLGVDSTFAWMEVVNDSLHDAWPFNKLRKEFVALFTCVVLMLVGVFFSAGSGLYWLQLLDSFIPQFILFIVGFLELICVCWLYGVRQFVEDVERYTGQRVNLLMAVLWTWLTPILMLVLVVFTFFVNIFEPLEPGKGDGVGQPFPGWALAIGWIAGLVTPLYILYVAIAPFALSGGGFGTEPKTDVPLTKRIVMRMAAWLKLRKSPAKSDKKAEQDSSTLENANATSENSAKHIELEHHQAHTEPASEIDTSPVLSPGRLLTKDDVRASSEPESGSQETHQSTDASKASTSTPIPSPLMSPTRLQTDDDVENTDQEPDNRSQTNQSSAAETPTVDDRRLMSKASVHELESESQEVDDRQLVTDSPAADQNAEESSVAPSSHSDISNKNETQQQ